MCSQNIECLHPLSINHTLNYKIRLLASTWRPTPISFRNVGLKTGKENMDFGDAAKTGPGYPSFESEEWSVGI